MSETVDHLLGIIDDMCRLAPRLRLRNPTTEEERQKWANLRLALAEFRFDTESEIVKGSQGEYHVKRKRG